MVVGGGGVIGEVSIVGKRVVFIFVFVVCYSGDKVACLISKDVVTVLLEVRVG